MSQTSNHSLCAEALDAPRNRPATLRAALPHRCPEQRKALYNLTARVHGALDKPSLAPLWPTGCIIFFFTSCCCTMQWPIAVLAISRFASAVQLFRFFSLALVHEGIFHTCILCTKVQLRTLDQWSSLKSLRTTAWFYLKHAQHQCTV